MRYMFCSALIVLSELALSAEPSIVGSKSVEPVSMANLTQWTVGLIFVLLMILLVAWSVKRFTSLGTSPKGNLRVLSGISLGNREKAVLIKAGNHHLLLGVSPGRVVNLHTFEAGEIQDEVGQTESSSASFQDSLQGLMKNRVVE